MNRTSYRGPLHGESRPDPWVEFLTRIQSSTPEQMREWWRTLQKWEKPDVRNGCNKAYNLVYLIAQLIDAIPDLIQEEAPNE